MSLNEYHLPESEYHLDGRLERLVETLGAIRVKARAAGAASTRSSRSTTRYSSMPTAHRRVIATRASHSESRCPSRVGSPSMHIAAVARAEPRRTQNARVSLTIA
jgi:hypothetical protein